MTKYLIPAALLLAWAGGPAAAQPQPNEGAVLKIKFVYQTLDQDKDPGVDVIGRVYNPTGGEIGKVEISRRARQAQWPDHSFTESEEFDAPGKLTLKDFQTKGFSVSVAQEGRNNPTWKMTYKVVVQCEDGAWYTVLDYADSNHTFNNKTADGYKLETDPNGNPPSFQYTDKVKLRTRPAK